MSRDKVKYITDLPFGKYQAYELKPEGPKYRPQINVKCGCTKKKISVTEQVVSVEIEDEKLSREMATNIIIEVLARHEKKYRQIKIIEQK